MAREGIARTGMVAVEGVIDKILGGGWCKVLLDNGVTIQAKPSGRLRNFRIRVLQGDRVRVEVSEMDFTKGLIVFRLT